MHMCFYAGAFKSCKVQCKFDIEWDRREHGFTFSLSKRTVSIINTRQKATGGLTPTPPSF